MQDLLAPRTTIKTTHTEGTTMANATATATKRPRKTAAERAQLDLDAAIKRRDAATAKLAKVEPTIAELRAEVEQTTALVTYLQQNPLLQQTDAPAPA